MTVSSTSARRDRQLPTCTLPTCTFPMCMLPMCTLPMLCVFLVLVFELLTSHSDHRAPFHFTSVLLKGAFPLTLVFRSVRSCSNFIYRIISVWMKCCSRLRPITTVPFSALCRDMNPQSLSLYCYVASSLQIRNIILNLLTSADVHVPDPLPGNFR